MIKIWRELHPGKRQEPGVGHSTAENISVMRAACCQLKLWPHDITAPLGPLHVQRDPGGDWDQPPAPSPCPQAIPGCAGIPASPGPAFSLCLKMSRGLTALCAISVAASCPGKAHGPVRPRAAQRGQSPPLPRDSGSQFPTWAFSTDSLLLKPFRCRASNSSACSFCGTESVGC